MKSKIPTMSLAAQENQEVIIELAASCCQKQSVYLTSSYKRLQLTKHQARVQTGCFKKCILSTALNSFCSILHLAWIPKYIFPIFRIIFRLHNSYKNMGYPQPEAAWLVKPFVGPAACSACPCPAIPKKTLPELLFLRCNRLPEWLRLTSKYCPDLKYLVNNT